MLQVYDNRDLKNEILEFKKYSNGGTFVKSYDPLAKTDFVFIKWCGHMGDLSLILSIIRFRFINAINLKPHKTVLKIDYLQNQQADRPFNGECYPLLNETLKIFNDIFAEFNNLTIEIDDPHNEDSVRVRLNNYKETVYPCILNVKKYIQEFNDNKSDFYFIFPDKSAYLKYFISLLANTRIFEWKPPISYMVKERELSTHKIINYNIVHVEQDIPEHRYKEKTIIIIDDLCIGGSTMIHAIKKCSEFWTDANYIISVSHKDFEKYNIPLNPELQTMVDSGKVKFL